MFGRCAIIDFVNSQMVVNESAQPVSTARVRIKRGGRFSSGLKDLVPKPVIDSIDISVSSILVTISFNFYVKYAAGLSILVPI